LAVYDTFNSAIVFKKVDLSTFTFYKTFLISSNTQLFELFHYSNTFTLFEIDLNFNSGTVFAFSDFVTSNENLNTETSSITFTSQSATAIASISPTLTNNTLDASIASYGTPAFKTFP